jgi:hypothetical protein
MSYDFYKIKYNFYNIQPEIILRLSKTKIQLQNNMMHKNGIIMINMDAHHIVNSSDGSDGAKYISL